MSKHRYHNYDDETVQRERTAHIRSTNRILSSRGKRTPPIVRLYRAIKALFRRTR
jgi:hypothetical protein